MQKTLFTITYPLRLLRIVAVMVVFVCAAMGVQADAYVGNDDTQVNLQVNGCNNNNVCEAGLGETYGNCSNDCIPPSSPGGGGGIPSGGDPNENYNIPPIGITDISAVPDMESVIISWTTNFISIGTLVWGTTEEFELGSVSEITFTQNHHVKIDNLIPGQKYYYRIDAQDTRNRVDSTETLEVSTKSAPDFVPPSNVRNVSGVVSGNTIQLSWLNPQDIDFDRVRITRLENTFPVDPSEGRVVYEGTGGYATDSNIVAGKKYYYTIFARDKAGNYSSGSIIAVIYQKTEVPSVKPGGEFPATTRPDDSTSVVITDPFTRPDSSADGFLKNVTLLDFDVIQRGEKKSFSNDSIRIDERDPVTISIPVNKFPANIKTLAITIKDPTNTSNRQTYLLTRSSDEKNFETTIEKFGIGGAYKFDIAIVDTLDSVQKKIPGTFVVPKSTLETSGGFEDTPITETIVPFVLLALILYGIRKFFILLFGKRRRKEEESLDQMNQDPNQNSS